METFTVAETQCKTMRSSIQAFGDNLKGLLPQNSAKSLFLSLDFEIYIAFNKATFESEGGNATQAGETLGNDLVGVRGRKRKLFEQGQTIWRDLQSTSEDPCVIITMTAARIKMPLVGTLFFGNGVGGFCKFSPEDTGVRCTPSGFFFNLEQRFTIEGGIVGILSKILASNADVALNEATQSSGNSIGVFQGPDGENEAVVFRLEFPVMSLFGVTLPSLRPVVHFQVIKGSEVERRRQTILRMKPRSSSLWVANCQQVDRECTSWANFYKSSAEAAADEAGTLAIQTQICTDILLNPEQDPDKLLYYNRILTAETLEDSQKWLITPPDGARFKRPELYNFEDNPDASVVIVYLAIKDFGNIVITIREISVTLIFSDRAPSMEGIDKEEFSQAESFYQAIHEEDKTENGGIWTPPSAFNFPSLQAYLDYLPEYDLDGNYTDFEGAVAAATTFNEVTSNTDADQMAVFVRVFCQISVLFLADIRLGFIMQNFADSQARNADLWVIVGQFDIDAAGLRFSVAVDKTFEFDARRRRHLLEDSPAVFERALQEEGLQDDKWNVAMEISCVPDTFCEAFVQFFEDLGAALWEGLQAIGRFFTEDLVNFANDVINAVGEWGRKFIGGIISFAEDLTAGIKDIFENGEVAKLVNGPSIKAFNDKTDAVVEVFSDGKFNIDDIVAVGEAVIAGVTVAVDFIVAGVTDLANAIGRFFTNAVNTIGQFIAGGTWTELRHSGFQNINRCASDCRAAQDGRLKIEDSISTFDLALYRVFGIRFGEHDAIMATCWCMDEFECPVKIPQKRECEQEPFCFGVFRTCIKCDSWSDTLSSTPNFVTRRLGFPRFDGRQFDEGCRLERMEILANSERSAKRMDTTGKLVDRNFESNFKGLSQFSPSNRRRMERRLSTQVSSVRVPKAQAVNNGNIPPRLRVGGKYSGARLSPDSTVPQLVNDQDFNLEFQLSPNPKFSDDPSYSDADLKAAEQGVKRGSAGPFLEDLKLDDDDFLSRQPIVKAPVIEIRRIRPFNLDCGEGGIAQAWRAKLQGSQPESMRQVRRRRRLQADRGEMNLLDVSVEAVVLQRLKQGNDLRITPGSISGGGDEDILKDAKDLLGTDGAGAFLNQDRFQRRQLQSIQDVELNIRALEATPLEGRFHWRFEVTATDRTGTSNPVQVEAFVNYAQPEVTNSPLTEIQTRCDTTPISIEELQDDDDLKFLLNVTDFKPQLRQDNCPNPLLRLEPIDETTEEGVRCTTLYPRVLRNWTLVHYDTGKMAPNIAPLYQQEFILGGLGFEGKPASPMFNLLTVDYTLPENGMVVPKVDDFLRVGEPATECSLCEVRLSQGERNFTNKDVTKTNTVTIAALNSIGVEVVRTTNVFIFNSTFTAPPSASPSGAPSNAPSTIPSVVPTRSSLPSVSSAPSVNATASPSLVPSIAPTINPSLAMVESEAPSVSKAPSGSPSNVTLEPSVEMVPSFSPSKEEISVSSASPSFSPSTFPSHPPSSSNAPTDMPSDTVLQPSFTGQPSGSPSKAGPVLVVPFGEPSATPSSPPSTNTIPTEIPSKLSTEPSAFLSPSDSPSQMGPVNIGPSRGPSTAPSPLPSTRVAPPLSAPNPLTLDPSIPSAVPSTDYLGQSQEPSSAMDTSAPSDSQPVPSKSPSHMPSFSASLSPPTRTSDSPSLSLTTTIVEMPSAVPLEEEKCVPISEDLCTTDAKPKCTPFRSPDYCPLEQSFSSLVARREAFVLSNSTTLDSANHWFHLLGDRGAAYEFTRAKNIATPAIYCCVETTDELESCFESDAVPASKFVVHRSGEHSDKGTFVFPSGFDGIELIRGMQMDLSQVTTTLKATVPGPASKIIVEQFISGSSSEISLPHEFKFHMFNGVVGSVTVMLNRGTPCGCFLEVDEAWNRLDQWGCFVPSVPYGLKSDSDACYAIDFVSGERNPYTFKGLDMCGPVDPPDPCVWDELIRNAKALSRDIGVYMRIDMFVTDDKSIYVQEYTRNHNGGLRHCAAKRHPVDGCVDSCFLGRTWQDTGGEQLLGGPKVPIPEYLNGYSARTAASKCEGIMNANRDDFVQVCARST